MVITTKRGGMLLTAFSIVLLVLLAFVKADIDKEEAFLCEVVHTSPNLDMSQCPAHNSNASWLLTASFGLAFFLFGGGLYLMLLHPPRLQAQEKKRHREAPASLNREEKQVFDFLQQHENSMYQSDLVKQTGFSKVKLTRLLDRMEGKGLVERKRRGMTNIVVLK